MRPGIPVRIRGERKAVLGASESTEVYQILEAIHRRLDFRIPSGDLTLVENWKGIEKPLKGSTLVLERWRSWGDERAHVEYIIKRRKSITRRRRKKGFRRDESTELEDGARFLRILDEEELLSDQEGVLELERFLDAVRIHSSDLEKLANLNDSLEEKENRIRSLLLELSERTPSNEDYETVKSEVDRRRKENAGLSELIRLNNDRVQDLQESLRNKEEETRNLEYDCNVVEKESKKLAKEYEKLMNIKIDYDEEEDYPSSSGFSSAMSYDNDSSLDNEEAIETFV